MSEETKIRRVRLSALSQHERNANTGTLRGRAALEDAIRQHGAADAGTLDRNGVILSGNKRAEVYSEAGMDEADYEAGDGVEDRLDDARALLYDMHVLLRYSREAWLRCGPLDAETE